MNLVELGSRKRNGDDWEPLIVETVAIRAKGIEELFQGIEKHKEYLLTSHTEKWRQILQKRVKIQLVNALKEQAFPDELTLAMMKRGAALRMQARQALASATAPASAGGSNRRYYRLDPESYDYFQYYYLYPRTLAAANQRFFSANGLAPGFGPYAYGYYGPPPFWPLPPSALGRP